MKGILGKKVGMTQVIKDTGEVVAVTVLAVGPCYVTQVRTPEKDGYRAVQLGYEPDKAKHLSKGERGHLEHSGVPLLRQRYKPKKQSNSRQPAQRARFP